MKRILIFILPILIMISAVFAVFGLIQVRLQEERIVEELKSKAKNVAESMELSAKSIFAMNDVKSAKKQAHIFQKRVRLQGCVFYNKDGDILAITDRISGWKHKEKSFINEIINSKASMDSFEIFNELKLYSYALPVKDDKDKILGVLEVVYDTSYIYHIINDLWQRISIALVVLIILIATIALLLQRQIFLLPIKRLTYWFQRFQKGEIDEQFSCKEIGYLGKLATEVEQAALGLRVARKSASSEAIERLNKEDLWNEGKLKDLVKAKLGENSLFVVSNREPYMHILDDVTGLVKCVKPASGVVTALDPVMRACGGKWIAQASGEADRKYVNLKNQLGVPPNDIQYILKRIWLTKEEEKGYYYGFSNEGLWPLCHITYTRPVFRETDWQMYEKVNQKFADSIIADLPAKNPLVFIQDYHFTTLAKKIKEKRPDAIIALFWHIPWPNPEVFSICPYQEEILEGMLACDLIGFHVQYHCNNFLDTANRLLECRVDTEKFSIVRANKETFIRSFPISVDNFAYSIFTEEDKQQMDSIRQEHDLEGKIIGLGVERIDYTKGISERIHAIDRFFEKFPQYKKKLVFIQLASPSRTHIKRYHDLVSEIDELIETVNYKYSEGNWNPIIYLKKKFSGDELKPYYMLADLCIVSSLHDGMNLVAKEYISSKHDSSGMLVLSCFTGAARELVDAVHINPYSTEKFADAIKYAIEIPADEKQRRMKNMRKTISENNVYHWAGNIINEICSIKKQD